MSTLLNVDLGELTGEPEALYAHAHIANVACGGHAGDAASMRRAVELCVRHATRLGAHPSYPDREGFGRRAMAMSPSALASSVAEQCARIARIASEGGMAIACVKAHGALYHAIARDQALAEAFVSGAREGIEGDVAVIGPASSAIARAAREAHAPYLREAFADRTTRPDGSLRPREEPGALLIDERTVAERARSLALRGDVETVCVHGDTPGAVALARAVREALDSIAGGSGA